MLPSPRMALVGCLPGDAEGVGDLRPGPAVGDGAGDRRALELLCQPTQGDDCSQGGFGVIR